MKLKFQIDYFKKSLASTFRDNCNFGLYALEAHLLDHVLKELLAFGALSELDASWIELYNVNTDLAYRQASRKMYTYMND